MTPEELAALPIRAFEEATKHLILELADGKRFAILGGRSRRPPSNGVVGFTPREMILILNSGMDEKEFRGLMKMREMGLNESIVEITQSGGEPVAAPEDNPWF